MYTYTIVGGGGGALPTSPLPLNTYSHNTATRRPPHPSNTQQHTTTHNNTQEIPTTDNNKQQQYTTALGYIKLPMSCSFLNSGTLIFSRRCTVQSIECTPSTYQQIHCHPNTPPPPSTVGQLITHSPILIVLVTS